MVVDPAFAEQDPAAAALAEQRDLARGQRQAKALGGSVAGDQHAIERAIALAGEDRVLKKEHLLRPLPMAGTDVPSVGRLATLRETVAEAEARHVRNVVAYTKGHRGEAARILGITRKNLWEKMREYGIEG